MCHAICFFHFSRMKRLQQCNRLRTIQGSAPRVVLYTFCCKKIYRSYMSCKRRYFPDKLKNVTVNDQCYKRRYTLSLHLAYMALKISFPPSYLGRRLFRFKCNFIRVPVSQRIWTRGVHTRPEPDPNVGFVRVSVWLYRVGIGFRL